MTINTNNANIDIINTTHFVITRDTISSVLSNTVPTVVMPRVNSRYLCIFENPNALFENRNDDVNPTNIAAAIIETTDSHGITSTPDGYEFCMGINAERSTGRIEYTACLKITMDKAFGNVRATAHSNRNDLDKNSGAVLFLHALEADTHPLFSTNSINLPTDGSNIITIFKNRHTGLQIVSANSSISYDVERITLDVTCSGTATSSFSAVINASEIGEVPATVKLNSNNQFSIELDWNTNYTGDWYVFSIQPADANADCSGLRDYVAAQTEGLQMLHNMLHDIDVVETAVAQEAKVA